MAEPKFLQRLARLPEVLTVLASYREGLPLGTLAERFETDAETLRQDLVTYEGLESWGWSFDIFRRPAIEFVQPDDGPPDEAPDRTVVRVVPDASVSLGVDHLSAGDLAVLYTAGVALLDVHPEDTALASALAVIAETMYGEPAATLTAGGWNRFLRTLQDGREERRRVRIVYSRAWSEGVSERVIEPLRLVQTHRGWEVDAGPVGPEGNLRTYLLSNIRSAEPTEESFTAPAGLDDLLARQRRTTTVRMELAQDARWAAEMYAEHVSVVEEDEEAFTADLELLPPAGERVGLIMLASGPSTRLLSPGSLLPEAVAVFEELLRHHTASS